MGPSCPSLGIKPLGSPVQKPALHRSISTKVLLSDGEDTPFTEHCRHYEASYRVSRGTRVLARAEEARGDAPSGRGSGHSAQTCLSLQRLQADVQNLKDQVQELHRDLTKHHSLIKAEIMGDILHRALQVDAQIAAEYACVQGLRPIFQEVAPSLWPPAESCCLETGSGREKYPEARPGPDACWAGSWLQCIAGCSAVGEPGLAPSATTPFSSRSGRNPTSAWLTSRRFMKVPRHWL